MRQFLALLLVAAVAGGLLWLSRQDPSQTNSAGAAQTPQPSGENWLYRSLSAQATAQVANRQAAQANQDALAYQAAVTAQAASEHAKSTATAAELTRQAESESTQQAWAVLSWTATADSVKSTSQAVSTAAVATAQAGSTATWEVYTQTAIVRDSAKQDADNQYALRARERAERRDDAVNGLLAWLPYIGFTLAGLAILMVGGVALVKYWRRPIVIQRNAWGDAPLLWDNFNDLVDADRVPAGVTRYLPGTVQAPALADPSVQERTTARDQTVDMTTRGIPGQPTAPRTPQRQPASTTMLPPAIGINFRVLPASETPVELQDPEKIQALDVEWREAK